MHICPESQREERIRREIETADQLHEDNACLVVRYRDGDTAGDAEDELDTCIGQIKHAAKFVVEQGPNPHLYEDLDRQAQRGELSPISTMAILRRLDEHLDGRPKGFPFDRSEPMKYLKLRPGDRLKKLPDIRSSELDQLGFSYSAFVGHPLEQFLMQEMNSRGMKYGTNAPYLDHHDVPFHIENDPAARARYYLNKASGALPPNFISVIEGDADFMADCVFDGIAKSSLNIRARMGREVDQGLVLMCFSESTDRVSSSLLHQGRGYEEYALEHPLPLVVTGVFPTAGNGVELECQSPVVHMPPLEQDGSFPQEKYIIRIRQEGGSTMVREVGRSINNGREFLWPTPVQGKEPYFQIVKIAERRGRLK